VTIRDSHDLDSYRTRLMIAPPPMLRHRSHISSPNNRLISRLNVATALAYSGEHNSRLIENHSYIYVNLFLLDLVDDLGPEVLIGPQYVLDLYPGHGLKSQGHQNSRSGNNLPESGSEDDISSVGEGSDDQNSRHYPGDVTMDSVDTISQRAKYIIPDFTILACLLRQRKSVSEPFDYPGDFPKWADDFDFWRLFRIEEVYYPALVEVKRPVSRTLQDHVEFLSQLRVMMLKATVGLRNQAKYAFALQPKLRRLLLIASVGEWWSWRILRREALEPVSGADGSSDFENDPSQEDEHTMAVSPPTTRENPVSWDETDFMPSSDEDLGSTSQNKRHHRTDKFYGSKYTEEDDMGRPEPHELIAAFAERGKGKAHKKTGTDPNPLPFNRHAEAQANLNHATDDDTILDKSTRQFHDPILYGSAISHQHARIVRVLLREFVNETIGPSVMVSDCKIFSSSALRTSSIGTTF